MARKKIRNSGYFFPLICFRGVMGPPTENRLVNWGEHCGGSLGVPPGPIRSCKALVLGPVLCYLHMLQLGSV